MSRLPAAPRSRPLIATITVQLACVVASSHADAQGCMPIRYTSPALGSRAASAPMTHVWQLVASYRWLYADQFFIGRDYRPASAPGGQPSRINISTVGLNLSYSPTTRLSLSLGVPVSLGTHSRLQGDGVRRTLTTGGLGDVSLVGTMWLFEPTDHPKGNLAFGLGVKAPTGRSDANGVWNTASGSELRPIDPSIQLGDGGWAGIVRLEAFRQVLKRTAVYGAGSYLVSPREHIGATFTTPYGVVAPVAVTDEYSAHAGLTFDAIPQRGLALSIGGRIDGVPVRDLIGGGDHSFRRPGYVVFVEPAIALRLSRSPVSPNGNTFSLSVPIRLAQNRVPSALEVANSRAGGGDFAKFLIFLGYTARL